MQDCQTYLMTCEVVRKNDKVCASKYLCKLGDSLRNDSLPQNCLVKCNFCNGWVHANCSLTHVGDLVRIVACPHCFSRYVFYFTESVLSVHY
jgi:hypothetical protein